MRKFQDNFLLIKNQRVVKISFKINKAFLAQVIDLSIDGEIIETNNKNFKI